MTDQTASSRISSGVRGTIVALGYLAVGLVAGYWAAGGQINPKSRLNVVASDQSQWSRIRESEPVLAIESEPFAGQHQEQTNYVAADGSRSDWVMVGTLTDIGPYAVIQVTRRATRYNAQVSLVESLNRLSNLRSARRHIGSEYFSLSTRYGDLRAVNLLVNADGIRKYCLGFHTPRSGKLFVNGLVCSPESSAVKPGEIACLLNSVRYLRDGDEQGLRKLVGEADSSECGATQLNGEDGRNPIVERRDTL